MLIESRVGIGEPSVGHVLEAVSDAEIPELQQYTGMTGELQSLSEIARKFMPGEKGGGNAEFDRQGELVACQYQHGANRADCRMRVSFFQAPQGQVGCGQCAPFFAEIEAGRQWQSQHELRLAEPISARTGAEAGADTGDRRMGCRVRDAAEHRQSEGKRGTGSEQGAQGFV